jgi:hypothetical protein
MASEIKQAQSNCFSNRFCQKGFVGQILSDRFCRTDFVEPVLSNRFWFCQPYFHYFVTQILSTIFCLIEFAEHTMSNRFFKTDIEQIHIVQPLVVFKVRVWYADLCSCSHTLIDGENFQTELSSWGRYYRTFHNCNVCRIKINVRDEVKCLEKCQTPGA